MTDEAKELKIDQELWTFHMISMAAIIVIGLATVFILAIPFVIIFY